MAYSTGGAAIWPPQAATPDQNAPTLSFDSWSHPAMWRAAIDGQPSVRAKRSSGSVSAPMSSERRPGGEGISSSIWEERAGGAAKPRARERAGGVGGAVVGAPPPAPPAASGPV